MVLVGPWPDWGVQEVVADPGESRLDLSIEALAAASTWELLWRQR
jgi:hypothetical protein